MHRYAIFSALFLPHLGGVEAFTAHVAEELVREGDEVMVVTSQLGDDPAHEVLENGVEVVRLPAYLLMGDRLPISKRNAEHARNLEHVRAWGPDRVLVNARFYEHSVEGLKLAQELDVPAVVLDHGSGYLSLSNPVADAVLKAYEHAMTARDKRFSPTFAGVSQKSAQWLRTFGIDTGLVVNNTIDAEAFRAASSGRGFRAELGIAPGALLCAFVGRLVPEKNPGLVAEAAALMPEAHFVIAGDGPERARLEGLAAPQPNLHLVGRLDAPDVSALFAQTDVMALPTQYPEGLPTAMLEAAAWGARPLVSADVAGVKDVFGETDHVLELGPHTPEGIVEALSPWCDASPEQRQAERRALAQYIDGRCGWPHVAEQLEQAFDSAEARKL